jgi:hypothetical protein
LEEKGKGGAVELLGFSMELEELCSGGATQFHRRRFGQLAGEEREREPEGSGRKVREGRGTASSLSPSEAAASAARIAARGRRW